MWSDSPHEQNFPHAPYLHPLCGHTSTKLGCLLSLGGHSISSVRGVGTSKQVGAVASALVAAPPETAGPAATLNTKDFTVEAALFVGALVVFYAVIIVLLLGTNMRGDQRHHHRNGYHSISTSRRQPKKASQQQHEVRLHLDSGNVTTENCQRQLLDHEDSTAPIDV